MTPPQATHVQGAASVGMLEAPPRIGLGTRSNRRSSQRVKVRGLWCDRGEMVDFSPRGMRLVVCRRWPEGLVRRIRLRFGEESHEVMARCIWCRQDGMFSHSVGVAFDELGAEAQAALERWMTA